MNYQPGSSNPTLPVYQNVPVCARPAHSTGINLEVTGSQTSVGGFLPSGLQQSVAGGEPPTAADGCYGYSTWSESSHAQPKPTYPPRPVPMGCPPGLEYLASIDQLLVHQIVELVEVLTGFETKNKFSVRNSLGQKVFYAVEQSDCCTRNCCGSGRPFGMKILDNYGNEVMHFERPLACQSCCFPCCLQTMEVYAPPGCLVGKVEQNWSLFKPSFSIKNASEDTVLLIEGPCLTFSACGDVEFKVLSPNGGAVVGNISKQWSGLIKELFTDADNFGITFPMDLDVRMKAVMLGACILIDAMYFERETNNSNTF